MPDFLFPKSFNLNPFPSSKFFLTLSLGSGDTFLASAPGNFPPHPEIVREIRTIRNKFKDNSFILAGATLNEGERKILTNTTSSGTLNINDTYESFEIHAGKRFKNKSLIPNLGTNLSYSYTPDHSESKYYSWDDKHVANFSLDLSDEFSIEREKSKSKFGIGWVLDYRTLITGSKTDYSVNGTKATYKQDDDLTKEIFLPLWCPPIILIFY